MLVSPAIGVSPVAAFARAQSSLGSAPGFEKSAWTDLLPEYDPYKYNSFTANAGDQMFRLTQRIAAQLDALGGGERRIDELLNIQAEPERADGSHADAT